MRVLGIETSCDESAVCVIDAQGEFYSDFQFSVLGNALISQTEIHAKYGGVFPNLAKREHAKNLAPILEKALDEAGMLHETPSDISAYSDNLQQILEREPELYAQLSVFLPKYARPEIDAIAVTVGPGLEPALWVGINFARALSFVWDTPIVAVNHMEGHIVMSLVEISTDKNEYSHILKNTRISGNMHEFDFPLLSLLISGGHTELVLSKEFQHYEMLGATRDDAVGEAYDKVARLLGLPYPGGPEISRLAEKARACDEATPHRIKLPRPMLNDDSLDFSFAGLKTAVRKIVDSKGPTFGDSSRSDLDSFRMQLAREFEDAVADVLVGKTMRACDEYGAKTVVVGGGVSANKNIRKRLKEELEKADVKLFVPPPAFATDNALMIALAGYFHARKSTYSKPESLKAEGNLHLGKGS